MTAPNQFICPASWTAIKNTISALTAAEASGDITSDSHGWLCELRDELSQLMVASYEPVEPFAVTEHFTYLLDRYVDGARDQDVADGSALVVEWARQTVESAAAMGIRPKAGGKECVWLVIHAADDPTDAL